MKIHGEKKIVPGTCKFCGTQLEHKFIDIALPESSSQLKTEASSSISTYVCPECFLIQMKNSTMLSYQERAYVSRFSSSWLNDMSKYISSVFKRFELTGHDLVAELVSHREYSNKDTKQSTVFFGNDGLQALIDMHGKADLLICNDELAYVNDINDFISAIKLFLKPNGIVTMEFLHLLPLMENKPFETPVTTDFSYFSFTTIDTIFKRHKLTIFNTEECSPKGCIRIYAKHPENSTKRISSNTPFLRGRERDKGMSAMSYYIDFKEKAQPRKTAA